MIYRHLIHFSLTEAQELLPEIITILHQLRELKHQLDAKGYDIRTQKYFGGMGPNGLKAFPDQMEELARLHRKLTMKGIILQDLEIGLIDFPSIRSNSEEIYLCYQLGESDIQFWHRLDDGFPGRQSIDTL